MEHLEGITILNEYMTYETPWFMWLFLGLLVASAIATLIVAANCEKMFPVIICSCFLVTFGVLLIVAGVGVWDIESGMIYECIIDDDVTYKELTSVYEIVEQRGDIYKLKFLD